MAVAQAQLRIDDLEWSDKFSLDTVGSSGTVQCKSKIKEVQNAEVRTAFLLIKFFYIIIITVIFKRLSLKALSALQDHEGRGGDG